MSALHVVWTWLIAIHWLPLAIVVIGYAVRLTHDSSRFPVTIPARWRPLLVLVLGQVYAVLLAVQAGAVWHVAALHGLEAAVWTMGLFDVLVKAVWNDQPPRWMQWLVFTAEEAIPRPGDVIPIISTSRSKMQKDQPVPPL